MKKMLKEFINNNSYVILLLIVSYICALIILESLK